MEALRLNATGRSSLEILIVISIMAAAWAAIVVFGSIAAPAPGYVEARQ